MKLLLFVLLFILGLIVLIMLIGAWPFFAKKDSQQISEKFSLPSLDEVEASNAKKLQRRLCFLFALLTIVGFFLGGQCKGEELQTLKMLYRLGQILIAVGPALLLIALNDKVALTLSRKKGLLLELGLIIILGVAELVCFIAKNSSNKVPLCSFKGATLFLTFVGIFGFLFFRISRKIDND